MSGRERGKVCEGKGEREGKGELVGQGHGGEGGVMCVGKGE